MEPSEEERGVGGVLCSGPHAIASVKAATSPEPLPDGRRCRSCLQAVSTTASSPGSRHWFAPTLPKSFLGVVNSFRCIVPRPDRCRMADHSSILVHSVALVGTFGSNSPDAMFQLPLRVPRVARELLFVNGLAQRPGMTRSTFDPAISRAPSANSFAILAVDGYTLSGSICYRDHAP